MEDWIRITVSGSRGVGKTTILNELAADLEARGFDCSINVSKGEYQRPLETLFATKQPEVPA